MNTHSAGLLAALVPGDSNGLASRDYPGEAVTILGNQRGPETTFGTVSTALARPTTLPAKHQ